MKKKNRNLPNQMLSVNFGDNLLPLWVDIIIFLITLIFIILFNMSWNVLIAVIGIMGVLDAAYYFIKWVKKIDF